MTLDEVRKRYLEYFQKAPRSHVAIPSASLVPENDPTTLFTGSGMQPLLPYLLGERHPKGVRLANSQKCFRAEDIEEVGDNRHTTFFEMLGNWSLGDYWKEEQLPWCFEFLTKEIGLDPNKLYVTVFAGDVQNDIPPDDVSASTWKGLFADAGIKTKDAVMGSEEDGSRRGMKEDERIFYYNATKNWWSRSGIPEKMPPGEPGGPDSEVFYDFETPHDNRFGEQCHPNCDCGRFMEIGNSVFMEYIKKADGTFEPLPQRNVDFGAGLERITAAKNNTQDVFAVDIFSNMIQHLEVASGKRYENEKLKQSFRVIADHMRAAIFMTADGVTPSNTDQGYALRRLIRRSMVKLRQLEISNFPLGSLVSVVVADYPDYFGKSQQIERHINGVITTEEARFGLTLEKGLREFAKVSKNDIAGHDAFALFATYGFPLEVILELTRERNISVDVDGFNKEMREHQVKSRAGAEQKFKGGLADEGEKTVALHTATHLLLAGLRKYVGNHVHQAGSNITTERARFDFTHTEKVGREVLDQVEVYVNEAIQKGCTVAIEEMPKEEAKQKEAEGSFWEKYPDVVKVYKVVAPDGTVYSQELCGGPHVKNTGVLGHFKIVKEEAVSAGVRRIKAVLE